MDREVIIIVKNWRDTVLHDLAGVVTFIVMIGVGVFLDSSAMQWAAALLWFVWVIGLMSSLAKKSRMTLTEAKALIAKMEEEGAQ